MRWILALLLVLLSLFIGCKDPVEDTNRDFEVRLTPERAQRGEEVTATLSIDKAKSASVSVAGTEVDSEVTGENTLIFVVPEEIESGLQKVSVSLNNEVSVDQTLGVLGDDIVPDQVMVVLVPPDGEDAINEDALRRFLEERGFSLIGERLSPLDGDIGPCSGELALIDINGVPLGQALEALEELEDAGIAVILGTDGVSAHAGGQTDYLEAIRADAAFGRELGGDGVTIAVLDSGVTETGELSGRLLDGYNFVADNTDAQDTDLHGTPIAWLAAGSRFGVAREALVLPVKVCEGGICFASNIVKGICWAFDNAPDGPEQLVINLSLGGDNPTEIIELLLEAAVDNGVAVAASGGNSGNGGPARYPAAHDLGGLMAVASVEQDKAGAWRPSDFSTWGDYIDIAGPRVDIDGNGIPFLGSGPSGSVGVSSGTSFSTPLVTGTMAILRGADKTLSPQDIQTCIEKGAQTLTNPPNEPEAVGAGLLNVDGALEVCKISN